MSGFMLCDDIMEMVGKEVVKKREQETLDYWIDIGWARRPNGVLDTIEYLCEGRDEIEHNMYEFMTLIDYMGWNRWVNKQNCEEDGEDFEGLETNAFEKGNVYNRYE